MKRIIALLLAVLMVGAVLVACGDDGARTVKTTVSKKYDDGYAKKYADSTTTDDDGNTTYEFTGDKYDSYLYEHGNVVSSQITDEVVKNHGKGFGQFTYIDKDKKAVIIGLNPGEYEEGFAKAEAPSYAEKAWSYFQSLEEPISTIDVIYCNANDQSEVYGTFSCSL